MSVAFRLLAACLLTTLPAWAAPTVIATFHDAAGDATGPGGYQPPGDTEFEDGDFDLRAFKVLLDGDEVVFEVTFGAPFRRPQVTARTGATELQLWNSIYLQNVDIYVDTDPSSAAGYTACIPGRRVAFAPGRTWKAAVVLTPQPGAARNIVDDAMGEAGRHVVFPQGVQTSGRTVIARVPVIALGGVPTRRWGWSVHVSGAAWERSFALKDRITGRKEANAFTMPVQPVREAWAFGGAPVGNAHPQVVDVLLPPGVDQKAVLGSFDAETGAWARVPFVYGEEPPPPLVPAAPPRAGPAGPSAPPAAGSPPPTAEAPPGAPGVPPAATVPPSLERPPPAALERPGSPSGQQAPASPGGKRGELKIADIADTVVSIAGPVEGIKPMQIGRVLDKDGKQVARVIVFRILETGVVASVLDGADKLAKGLKVDFGPR